MTTTALWKRLLHCVRNDEPVGLRCTQIQAIQFAFFAFFLALFAQYGIAQSPAINKPKAADVQQRLLALQREVAALKDVLRAKDSEKSAAERALQAADLAIAESARAVLALTADIQATQTELTALNDRRYLLELDLETERQQLARLLRSAYAIGQLEQVKLALSQAKVAQVGRVLAYHTYVNQARINIIEKIKLALSELTQIRVDIQAKTTAYGALILQESKKTAELKAGRTARAALLIVLQAELATGADELQRLNADTEALNNLLGQLSDLLADIPKDLPSAKSFASQKGALFLPVQGGVIIRKFGNVSELGRRANGLLITAPQSAPVRAVAGGRVAFSGWLRGLGLLAIIDHGDGFLSLYGHCETLLKVEGDWINTSEVIARVGATELNSAGPALHFELRRNSLAIDPGAWLKR